MKINSFLLGAMFVALSSYAVSTPPPAPAPDQTAAAAPAPADTGKKEMTAEQKASKERVERKIQVKKNDAEKYAFIVKLRDEVRKLKAKMLLHGRLEKKYSKEYHVKHSALLGGRVKQEPPKPSQPATPTDKKQTSMLGSATMFTSLDEDVAETGAAAELTPLDKAYETADKAAEEWDKASEELLEADDNASDALYQKEEETFEKYSAALESLKQQLIKDKDETIAAMDETIAAVDEELADPIGIVP